MVGGKFFGPARSNDNIVSGVMNFQTGHHRQARRMSLNGDQNEIQVFDLGRAFQILIVGSALAAGKRADVGNSFRLANVVTSASSPANRRITNCMGL